MSRLPIVFFGHGSPMIALENNAVTQTWKEMADRIGKPRAILCISAHWQTRGTAVTAMAQPRTIHDFGAFPQALFDMQYPAPGDPELAARVQELLAPMPVKLDANWGLDHGTWTVLVHAYPEADIPVIQLGMDVAKSPAEHWEVGRMLRPLRDEGVLIMGTGNIVHNLPAMDWGNPAATPYPWAEQFNSTMCKAIADDTPQTVIDYEALGDAARLSVPSSDHFLPLLYVLGARHEDETAEFQPHFIQHKSLSMTSVLIDAA
ncbi:4,5-DOPA dioxygenase extradiol [Novosphingobium mangrovi (ex Huang et al. 2023)]|uniref:4,5-DOPA dioxygenase extradiol n=1 Tax=Novosphingobium mangrovi (ex Huang et al. 2023) TaxID=2976432 RepID=A0ABT2I6J8_9SPHN|nr:4,5-DOPA dioxygenase extradiol [Novosphingobium mangrovi (ex Huang et al. 2023)]MCT2400443.1 4,5-DOPA dioxygenase extradiol [Novosphingobium mangrovi (ex Huang et al. 2023)]